MREELHISTLTTASQKKLAKKLDLPELREMALLHQSVIEGNKSLCQYRNRERELIQKYGFKVRT